MTARRPPPSSPRACATHAYWTRWRREQRDRKAREAREALEALGQLGLDLAPRELTAADRALAEVFD